VILFLAVLCLLLTICRSYQSYKEDYARKLDKRPEKKEEKKPDDNKQKRVERKSPPKVAEKKPEKKDERKPDDKTLVRRSSPKK
jgi:hypothetical protein